MNIDELVVKQPWTTFGTGTVTVDNISLTIVTIYVAALCGRLLLHMFLTKSLPSIGSIPRWGLLHGSTDFALS